MTLTPGFSCALDLFKKLKRDRARIDLELSPDVFFDFVVTAWSVFDWVKEDKSLPTEARREVTSGILYKNRILKTCGDLANSSKHFHLDHRRKTPITAGTNVQTGYGTGRFGVGGFGVGEVTITISMNDGTSHEAIAFCDSVVGEWHGFFTRHGVSVA